MPERVERPSTATEKNYKVLCRICSLWFQVASEKKPKTVPQHRAGKFSGNAKCLGWELSPREVRAL